MGLSLNYVIFGKCGWVVEAKEEIDYFAFQKDYLVEVVGGEMAKLIISAFNWITFKNMRIKAQNRGNEKKALRIQVLNEYSGLWVKKSVLQKTSFEVFFF